MSPRMRTGTSPRSSSSLCWTRTRARTNMSTSCRRSSSTARSSSASRISNRFWSRKPGSEDCLCHKSYPARKRSLTRRQQRWPTHTAGLSSSTRHSLSMPSEPTSPSSSSSLRLSRTSAPISTSLKRWPFSRPRYSRTPLTHLNLWSLRRKSTGFSDQMLSTSLNVKSIWNNKRSSTHNWQTWIFNKNNPKIDRKESSFVQKYPKSGGRSSSKETKVKSDPSTLSSRLTVHFKVDHQWFP